MDEAAIPLMSRRNAYLACALPLLALLTGLGGCEDSFNGRFDLSVSGSPAGGVRNVVVAFRAVTLGGGGSQTNLPLGTEQTVDLESSGQTPIVTDVIVPAGDYQWIRLDVDADDSYVIADNGNRYPLDVGSLKTEGDFTVGEGLTSDILITVELHQALVIDTSGAMPSYALKPVSRLVDEKNAGTIAGSVPDSLVLGSTPILDNGCDPQVYVYEGAGIVPEGFNVPVTGGTEPFTLTSSLKHEDIGFYFFSITSLPAGTYTLAVTCAAKDVPGASGLDFSSTRTARVEAGQQTRVRF